MAESKSKERAKERLEQLGYADEEAEAVMSQLPEGRSIKKRHSNHESRSKERETDLGVGHQVFSIALVILISVILTLEHLLERLRMTKFSSTHYDDPLFKKVSYLGLFLSIISLVVSIFALIGVGWYQSSYLIAMFSITTIFFLHSTMAGGIRNVR